MGKDARLKFGRYTLRLYFGSKRKIHSHGVAELLYVAGVRRFLDEVSMMSIRLSVASIVGALWENFLIVERMKTQAYRRQGSNRYYWRTYTGAELDYVEEQNGAIKGFEFKFNQKTVRAPQAWSETYPQATFQTINKDNYLDFLLD